MDNGVRHGEKTPCQVPKLIVCYVLHLHLKKWKVLCKNFTFFFMMNSKSLMGENLPQGGKRIVWNVLMGVAAGMAALGSYSSISASPFKTYGMYGMGSFILLALIVQVVRKKPDVGA